MIPILASNNLIMLKRIALENQKDGKLFYQEVLKECKRSSSLDESESEPQNGDLNSHFLQDVLTSFSPTFNPRRMYYKAGMSFFKGSKETILSETRRRAILAKYNP